MQARQPAVIALLLAVAFDLPRHRDAWHKAEAAQATAVSVCHSRR